MSDLSIPLKLCSKCKEQFPQTPDYFHRCPANKDGLSYVCKGCKHGNGWKETLPNGMRRCKKCRNIFPDNADHFAHRGEVLRNVCRECYKTQRAKHHTETRDEQSQKQKARYRANPEPYKARSKRTYHNTPDRSKAYSKKWIAEHPEARKAITHRHYIKHKVKKAANGAIYSAAYPERRREQSRRRRAENPEKSRLYVWTRLARLAGAEGSHTVAEKAELYELQDGRCGYCGIPVSRKIKGDAHLDHMVPITRGGSNYIENLLYACGFCNRSKHNRTIQEWQAVRGW